MEWLGDLTKLTFVKQNSAWQVVRIIQEVFIITLMSVQWTYKQFPVLGMEEHRAHTCMFVVVMDDVKINKMNQGIKA